MELPSTNKLVAGFWFHNKIEERELPRMDDTMDFVNTISCWSTDHADASGSLSLVQLLITLMLVQFAAPLGWTVRGRLLSIHSARTPSARERGCSILMCDLRTGRVFILRT
jgi:hypothetical protein